MRLQRPKTENTAPSAALDSQTQEHVKGIIVIRVLAIALLLVVVGGLGFLATWEIPAPLAPVETVVPDARFDR